MFIELTVRLKEKPELGLAKVKRFYDEGGVKLDRELDGFTSWDLSSLEIISQRVLEEADLQKMA